MVFSMTLKMTLTSFSFPPITPLKPEAHAVLAKGERKILSRDRDQDI